MIDNIQNQIYRALQRFKTAIMGRITSVKKNTSEVFVSFSDSDELRDVKIIAPYGIYSMPTNGKNAQIIFNNSNKKASLIGIENGSGAPIQIDIGEVLIYNENANTFIHLKNNGNIDYKGNLNKV